MSEDRIYEDSVPEKVIEPKDYFDDLKTKLDKASVEKLEENRAFLEAEIEKAYKMGQKNLINKTSYMWTIIEREMALCAVGIDQYVMREDVTKFIDEVTPKNSVKIVELENYPRSIPPENAEVIQHARDLEIFDKILIVYTDFTNEEVLNDEQKKMVERNRDPIAFGMFMNEVTNLKHDRLYFITDWEDEFCDLTFTKMLDKMSSMGIDNAGKVIRPDSAYITRIVQEAIDEIDKDAEGKNLDRSLVVVETPSFIQRIKNRIFK